MHVEGSGETVTVIQREGEKQIKLTGKGVTNHAANDPFSTICHHGDKTCQGGKTLRKTFVNQ